MFLEEENMKWMKKKRKIALISGGHQGDSSGVHALQQDQHFEDNGSCRLRQPIQSVGRLGFCEAGQKTHLRKC